MTRGCAGALVAIALISGLALRLARLDVRPMHHDEANQAVKFGALLERGEYHYDTQDHHGPTLYYLTLPAAWLRGQTTLASLDERTLRGVTAVFGAATILLLPLLSAGRWPDGGSHERVAAGALARDGLLLADVHPGIAVRLLHAGVRDCRRAGWRRAADSGRPRLRESQRGWRSRPRRPR